MWYLNNKDKGYQEKDTKRPNPGGKKESCLTTVLYTIGKGYNKRCARESCLCTHIIPRKPFSQETANLFKAAIQFYKGPTDKSQLLEAIDINTV